MPGQLVPELFRFRIQKSRLISDQLSIDIATTHWLGFGCRRSKFPSINFVFQNYLPPLSEPISASVMRRRMWWNPRLLFLERVQPNLSLNWRWRYAWASILQWWCWHRFEGGDWRHEEKKETEKKTQSYKSSHTTPLKRMPAVLEIPLLQIPPQPPHPLVNQHHHPQEPPPHPIPPDLN